MKPKIYLDCYPHGLIAHTGDENEPLFIHTDKSGSMKTTKAAQCFARGFEMMGREVVISYFPRKEADHV